jgi:hypothetical protein
MSAPTAARWLIVPRITTGTRRLAAGLGRWLAATDLKGWTRFRGVLGRLTGTAFIAWFLGGMLWAMGTPPWAMVPVWLGCALFASYREQRDADDERAAKQAEEIDPVAFAELLHDVARGGNVHLTAIRAQLAEETGRDWDVLALCRAAGIRTRPVRVPGAAPAVTTGIHKTDLPPLPRVDGGAPGGVVSAGHAANNNSNNTTVEAIGGGAAWLIKHGPSPRQEAR